MRGLPAKGTFNQTWEGRLSPGRGQSTLATPSPWPRKRSRNAGMSRHYLKHQYQDNTQPTSGSSRCECKASGHTSAPLDTGLQSTALNEDCLVWAWVNPRTHAFSQSSWETRGYSRKITWENQILSHPWVQVIHWNHRHVEMCSPMSDATHNSQMKVPQKHQQRTGSLQLTEAKRWILTKIRPLLDISLTSGLSYSGNWQQTSRVERN